MASPLKGYDKVIHAHVASRMQPIHFFLERDVAWPWILRFYVRDLEGNEIHYSDTVQHWWQNPQDPLSVTDADDSRILYALDESNNPIPYTATIDVARIYQRYGKTGVVLVELWECDPDAASGEERLHDQFTTILNLTLAKPGLE